MIVFSAVSSNRIELSNGKYRFHEMLHRIANTRLSENQQNLQQSLETKQKKNPDFNDDFAFVRKSHVLFWAHWPRISFAFRMKHSEAIKAVFGFSMLRIWTSAILFFLSFGLLVITIWLDDFSYGWWISSICVCFHSKKKFCSTIFVYSCNLWQIKIKYKNQANADDCV